MYSPLRTNAIREAAFEHPPRLGHLGISILNTPSASLPICACRAYSNRQHHLTVQCGRRIQHTSEGRLTIAAAVALSHYTQEGRSMGAAGLQMRYQPRLVPSCPVRVRHSGRQSDKMTEGRLGTDDFDRRIE